MIHRLKIKHGHLKNLIAGRKRAEIRFNDRNYQTGDLLSFLDYSTVIPKGCLFEITHIYSGIGLEKNYVVLSVKPFDG